MVDLKSNVCQQMSVQEVSLTKQSDHIVVVMLN